MTNWVTYWTWCTELIISTAWVQLSLPLHIKALPICNHGETLTGICQIKPCMILDSIFVLCMTLNQFCHLSFTTLLGWLETLCSHRDSANGWPGFTTVKSCKGLSVWIQGQTCTSEKSSSMFVCPRKCPCSDGGWCLQRYSIPLSYSSSTSLQPPAR